MKTHMFLKKLQFQAFKNSFFWKLSTIVLFADTKNAPQK